MTRTPIPNCPQPETPIRERAWADGQRHEPKYSVEEVRTIAAYERGSTDKYVEIRIGMLTAYADLLERIAADERVVPVAEVGRDWTLHWVGHGPIAPIITENNIRIGDKLFPHPPAQAAQFDRARETPRRQKAVETLLKMGWTYNVERGWEEPAPTAAPVAQGDANRGRCIACGRATDSACDGLDGAGLGCMIAHYHAVPDGWVMVPREPTKAMLEAFFDGEMSLGHDGYVLPSSCWQAMLAAAPRSPCRPAGRPSRTVQSQLRLCGAVQDGGRPMTAPDDVRARFEAWASGGGKCPKDVERVGYDDSYRLMATHLYWLAWQAAHADIPDVVRELATEVIEAINDGDAQSARNAAQAALDKFAQEKP